MDWAALGSREAVLAVCARFRVDFAQAEDYLLARQLGQAEERAGAAEHQQQRRVGVGWEAAGREAAGHVAQQLGVHHARDRKPLLERRRR